MTSAETGRAGPIDAEPARPIIDGETGRLIGPGPIPAPAAAGGPATPSRHPVRGRFVWIYAALAVVAAAGLAAFVVLLVQDDGGDGGTRLAQPWSDFSPDGSPYGRVQDIANYVTTKYKLADGTQLTGALAGPPLITSNQAEGSTQILVSAVAVRPDLPAGGSAADRDIVLLGVNASTSVQYMLCGYGQNCSIAKGEPSVERHTLLRREALELALFTFKYLRNVNSVSVFLPPRPDGAAAPTMVFFQRDDLASQLDRPLSRTLDPKAPGIGKIATDELDTVNRLTQKRLYQYNYTQAQDGSAVMLLDPVVT